MRGTRQKRPFWWVRSAGTSPDAGDVVRAVCKARHERALRFCGDVAGDRARALSRLCYGRDMTDTPTTQATETPSPPLPSRIAFVIRDVCAFPRDLSPKDFTRFARELMGGYDEDGRFDAVRRGDIDNAATGFKAGARWIIGPRLGIGAPPGTTLDAGHVIFDASAPTWPLFAESLRLPARMLAEIRAGFTLERHGIHWYAFPMSEETKSEPPASVDVVIQTRSEPPPAELPHGRWGWDPAKIPPGSILVYQTGTWYRSGRGIEFCFAEPPRMATGKGPGYWVGKVLMRDGRVGTLIWGPQTRVCTWWECFTADHFGRKQVVT
jgi:hypothetical protein